MFSQSEEKLEYIQQLIVERGTRESFLKFKQYKRMNCEVVNTCIQQLSMIMFSYLILGYSCATSAQLCRNKPSPNFLKWHRAKKCWGTCDINHKPYSGLSLNIPKYANNEEASLKMDSHDIGFVDSRDFASALLGGIIKGKLGDTPWLFSGDDLQTFNHTWYTLNREKEDITSQICSYLKTWKYKNK